MPHSNPKTSLLRSLLWLCLSIFWVTGCASAGLPWNQPPILLGFAGELTGKNADLGVFARNGLQLAIETINAEGGIYGRKLSLLPEDDQGNPANAQTVDQKLIEQGVVAIVGHMTSTQTTAGMVITEKAGVVLISPTSTSSYLSGKDDSFFSISPSNIQSARQLARLLATQHHLLNVSFIENQENLSFTSSFRNAFLSEFIQLNGQHVGNQFFSSAQISNITQQIHALRQNNPESLIILASPMDTALIAQQVRKEGWNIPLFATNWSQTETLTLNGGKAIEGMHLVQGFDGNSQNPAYLTFVRRYADRFGPAPTYAAAYAYETGLVLREALLKTHGRSTGLKQAILKIQVQGLIGPLSFNPSGDIIRPDYLVTIQDGKFVTLAELPSLP